MREAARIDQKLLRHAAADHAGAADAPVLGDHHLRAVAGGDAGGAHSAGAGADDEEVGLVAHVTLPSGWGADALARILAAAPPAKRTAIHQACQAPWPTSMVAAAIVNR